MAEIERGGYTGKKVVEKKGPPPPPGLSAEEREYAIKHGPPQPGKVVRDNIDVERARGVRRDDLGDTVSKAREALVKDSAARQAKYDKAMKAADGHIRAGDQKKALAELKKAHDGADETFEELQVAKKAADLGDRKLARDALYAARNLSRTATAADQVAKTAESLGFHDIAEMAREDEYEMIQERHEKREKARKPQEPAQPQHKTETQREGGGSEILDNTLKNVLIGLGTAATVKILTSD